MDPAVLERLMLDRALGAMQADVEVLLGAYLHGRAEELREAQAWQEVVGEVRRVVAVGEVAAMLPGFSAVRKRQWWERARSAGRLAACVVLGAALAAAWFEWRHGNVGGQRTTVIARSQTPRETPNQRVVETAGVQRRESRAVVWLSPVRAPVVGG